MMGFSYQQLFQALQSWPLKKNQQYLANLNRMIYLGELRCIRDLDLDIFDVTDTTPLTLNQTVVPKPAGSQPLTFAAPIAQGDTSGNLGVAWAGTTGKYVATFSDNEIQLLTLTNGQAGVIWTLPMAAAVTANAVLAPLFIVEKSLWVIYSGAKKFLTKRSFEYLQNYSSAPPGRPKYFADQGEDSWIIGPAADANATAIQRTYVRRPPSIIVAQNTWIGDNEGDLLFTACLMESEQFLKADDRYADMRTKYYQELLPKAKGEVQAAARSGEYMPMQPIATVAQPSAPPQQG
jgi:hypothetical protein